MTSALVQSARRLRSTEPDSLAKEAALDWVLARYPRLPPPVGTERQGDVWFSVSRVKKIIAESVGDSGAGLPCAPRGRNKGPARDNLGDDLVRAALSRLYLLSTTPPDVLAKKTAKELVVEGYACPIRVFIKNELHPISKLAEGRARLIFNQSFVQSIANQYMTTPQNKEEIRNAEDCPSVPGLDLDSDEAADNIFSRVFKGMKNPISSDVSGWDFSVSKWMLDLDAEARIRLAGVENDSPFAWFARNKALCEARKICVSSHGVMFELPEGVVVTGSDDTASTNSRIRNMVSILAGATNTFSMGDDNVTDHPNLDEYKDKMLSMGFRLTDVKRCNRLEGVEFCSRYFFSERAVPLDSSLCKGLKNLLNKPPNAEMMLMFKYQYRHSPLFGWALGILAGAGWTSEDA